VGKVREIGEALAAGEFIEIIGAQASLEFAAGADLVELTFAGAVLGGV